MNQGNGLGSFEVCHLADEGEIFLYGILQYDDISFLNARAGDEGTRQVIEEGQEFIVVDFARQADACCPHRVQHLFVICLCLVASTCLIVISAADIT